MKDEKNTSDILESVVVQSVEDSITLFEIKEILHERGFALLMLLFSLPLSIPLPVPPGYTTILSLPIIFFAVQIIIGYDSPWLPNFLGKKSIKRKTLAFLIEKTVPILRKLEKLTRARIPLFNNPVGERVYGIISLLCGLSIAIPLPLTNFIPAGGIVFMSLGVLNRDGIMAILGMVTSAVGLLITALVILLGHKVVVELFSILNWG
jgi:hypothetical protein